MSTSNLFVNPIDGSFNINGTIKINNYQAVNGPIFRVISTATQSIPNDVNTLLQFQSKIIDTNNCFSIATHTFTPNIGGYYQINASCRISGSTASVTALIIYKNNSAYSSANIQKNGNSTGPVISDIVYLNGSTDFIQMYVYQNAGTALLTALTDNNSALNTAVWFSGCMIRGI
jgi:hypothetical protein